MEEIIVKILLRQLAFFTIILTGNPCSAADPETLKSTVTLQGRLQPIDETLSPGHIFDPKFAAKTITDMKTDIQWYKVPIWDSGTWSLIRTQRVFAKDEISGNEDHALLTPKGASVGRSGCFSDRTGQIWDYIISGRRTDSEWEDGHGFSYKISGSQSAVTKNSLEYQNQSLAFLVDRRIPLIKKCWQIMTEGKVWSTSSQTTRTKALYRCFNWLGDPTFTYEYIFDYKRIAPFKEDRSVTTPDGTLLYPLFTKFLADSHMNDSIP